MESAPDPARLDAQLSRAIDHHHDTGRDFAYLICDIDDLDQIGARLGEARADDLVSELVLRITDAVRTGDVVIRTAPGQFVVLAADTDATRAAHIARGFVEAVEGVVDLDGSPVWASISVGAASSSNLSVDEVTRAATSALRDAKRRGHGTSVVFDPMTPANHRTAWRICSAPSDAARAGTLQMRYQPIVRFATNEVIGAEAIVWSASPTGGEIPRRQLVAAAEAGGFMRELGGWMLRHACVDAAGWPEHQFVTVDVSGQQLTEDLLLVVHEALVVSGLRGERLWLELGENMLFGESSRTRSLLRRLTSLGVRISLDEFGAGYRAMTYVRDLPLHAVKVDGAFVSFLDRTADDAAIGAALVKLAGSLDVPIVGDGVQNAEQAQALLGLGVEAGQGSWWGAAVSASELADIAAEIERRPTTWLIEADRQPSRERPEPGPAVSAILNMHRLGASPASIAAVLNQEGTPSPTGARWRQVAVAQLIVEWA